MRLIMIAPFALLAACQVSEGNNSVTVAYNQDVAENAVEDVANAAQEAGTAIANGTEQAVDRAQNVQIEVDTNTADNDNSAVNSN